MRRRVLFNRKEKSPAPQAPVSDNPDKKGRPTPSRKEVEAANRARAKAAARGRNNRQAVRDQRVVSSRQIREGIKAGDERYLPKRDKGPVRRFARDTVDSRLTMAEFAFPMVFVVLIAGLLGFTALASSLELLIVLMILLDSIWLTMRLRRELPRRFPDASTKGVRVYALMRLLQPRIMRIPRSQVKIGQQLPDKY